MHEGGPEGRVSLAPLSGGVWKSWSVGMAMWSELQGACLQMEGWPLYSRCREMVGCGGAALGVIWKGLV